MEASPEDGSAEGGAGPWWKAEINESDSLVDFEVPVSSRLPVK